MKDKEILTLQTRILERVARLETHVKDQNGWVKALNEKINSVDSRLWAVLVGEILLVITIMVSFVK